MSASNFSINLSPHHGLLLVERSHELPHHAAGAGEVPTRCSIIHRGERLGTEPIGVREVERGLAPTVERGGEHADGVARGGGNLVADGSKALLFRPCGAWQKWAQLQPRRPQRPPIT